MPPLAAQMVRLRMSKLRFLSQQAALLYLRLGQDLDAPVHGEGSDAKSGHLLPFRRRGPRNRAHPALRQGLNDLHAPWSAQKALEEASKASPACHRKAFLVIDLWSAPLQPASFKWPPRVLVLLLK